MASVMRCEWTWTSVLRSLVVAAIVLATAATGCSDQGGPEGKPLHAPASFDPTLPAYVACSRLIVEGDVVSVSDSDSAGRMITELAVHEWVKPASGPKTARIETIDIAAERVYERWQPGTHLFLQVDLDPSALPSWQFDARTIKRIKHAVPASHTIECPYGPE
jgi:hypothetical protein